MRRRAAARTRSIPGATRWRPAREPSAAPYPHWNARIHAECYRPNAFARIHDGKGRIAAIVDNYERISFNFVGSRPPDVVKFINDAKQMNVIIDPAVSERLRTVDLSLEVKDVSVREALRALCEQIGGVTFDVHEKEEIVWLHAVR